MRELRFIHIPKNGGSYINKCTQNKDIYHINQKIKHYNIKYFLKLKIRKREVQKIIYP